MHADQMPPLKGGKCMWTKCPDQIPIVVPQGEARRECRCPLELVDPPASGERLLLGQGATATVVQGLRVSARTHYCTLGTHFHGNGRLAFFSSRTHACVCVCVCVCVSPELFKGESGAALSVFILTLTFSDPGCRSCWCVCVCVCVCVCACCTPYSLVAGFLLLPFFHSAFRL